MLTTQTRDGNGIGTLSRPERRAKRALLLVAGWLLAATGAHAALTGGLVRTGTAAAPTGTAAFNALPSNVMGTLGGGQDVCAALDNATTVSAVAAIPRVPSTSPLAANYIPGNDACGTDLVVRTNDIVTYEMQYRVNSNDTVTITSTLPTSGGQPIADWLSSSPGNVVSACTAGSSISPDGQTFTCVIPVTGVVGSLTAAILAEARVRGSIANATAFPIPVTSMTGAGGGSFPSAHTETGSTAGPLVVSAAPLYDVVKQSDARSNFFNRYAAKDDTGADGWLLVPTLAVRIPYGTKGIEKLNGALTLTEAMSSLVVTGVNGATGVATAASITVQNALRAGAKIWKLNNTPGWVANNPGLANLDACVGVYGINGSFSRDVTMPTQNLNPSSSATRIGTDVAGTCAATQAGGGRYRHHGHADARYSGVDRFDYAAARRK